MKVIVAHSKTGKIISVAIPNPKSDKTVMPRTKAGHLVAEVDVHSIKLGASDVAARFSELQTNFKVRISPRGPELVRIKE
jgi:hypothetical protein